MVVLRKTLLGNSITNEKIIIPKQQFNSDNAPKIIKLKKKKQITVIR